MATSLRGLVGLIFAKTNTVWKAANGQRPLSRQQLGFVTHIQGFASVISVALIALAILSAVGAMLYYTAVHGTVYSDQFQQIDLRT